MEVKICWNVKVLEKEWTKYDLCLLHNFATGWPKGRIKSQTSHSKEEENFSVNMSRSSNSSANWLEKLYSENI